MESSFTSHSSLRYLTPDLSSPSSHQPFHSHITTNAKPHKGLKIASPAPTVRVGVGVFILSSTPSSTNPNPNPSFLIGRRLGSHGSGTYALPGGHLEFGETPEECAAREVLEETGLVVKDVKFFTATNDIMLADKKHYITLFMTCVREDEGAKPKNMEPEKCEGWEWIEWGEMKEVAKKEMEWLRRLGGPGVEGQESGRLYEGRRLFSPLLALLRQREGLIPGVNGHSAGA